MPPTPHATLTRQFGHFVAATHYRSLPGPVVEALKLRMLDLLGAHCAGIAGGHHLRLLALLSGDGVQPVWGTAHRRPARDACIINTAVSHATYMEDGSRYTGGHPSSAVIPAALTLAHARQASGAALLAAVAVGYEVFLRLGTAIYPSIVQRGFQSTAILAAPAAAAATASLLGLSGEQAGHALAVAASQGAGLKGALQAANSQPLQVGRSAEGGWLAAHYCALGATGAADLWENGFLKAYAAQANEAGIAAALGQQWQVGDTYLKQYGGCRGNHAAVDACLAAWDKDTCALEDIAHILVQVDSVTRAAAIEPPTDGEQAQFSLAFSIAARLLTGDLLPARFQDATLAEPAIQALMRRIDVVADPALDVHYPQQRPAIVTLTLLDGRQRQARVDIAHGEPETPLTDVQVARKFHRLADPVLGAPAAAAVFDAVMGLETADSLAPLLAALCPSSEAILPAPRPKRI